MKILDRERLEQFCRKHADARKWIENWLGDVETARWLRPQNIRGRYAAASFLAEGIAIFNVKSNTYRLEVSVVYRTGIVAVEWVGTHAECDERYRKR